MKALASAAAVLAAGIALAACVAHKQEQPPLTGPSQLANLLVVTATPDSITQNGGDQSTIRITSIGPDGNPVPNVPVRLDMLVNGVTQDFGTLTAKSLVTGSNGVATAVFTAPTLPAGSLVGSCQASPTSTFLPGNCVTIRATPTGTAFETAQSEAVTIRLVPPGLLLPPVKTPRAAFTFLPGSPLAGQSVAFNATTSCAEADSFGNCVTPTTLTITSYTWTFGDGSGGTGPTPTHTYSTAGPFVVTLTVTNSSGGAATAQNAVTVGLAPAPTADFVVSPTAPTVGTGVIFNADTSKTAPGHNIVQYSWNFGDPNSSGAPAAACGGAVNANTSSSAQACHVYTAPGSYSVTLSIVDDTGQRAVSTKTVTVS